MSIGEVGPGEVLPGDAGVEGAEAVTGRGPGGDLPADGDPQPDGALMVDTAGDGVAVEATDVVAGSGEAGIGAGMLLPEVQPETPGSRHTRERKRPRWLLPAVAVAAAVAVATVVVVALPSGSKPAPAHPSQGGKAPAAAPSRAGGTTGGGGNRQLPLIPPSQNGVTHSGVDPETIVTRSDGSVVTYQWLPGGAGVAEYVRESGGVVAERAWNSDGSVAGNYRLSCSGPNVMDSQEIGSGKWTTPFSVGQVANACASGSLTPLAYARGFANNNHTPFIMQQAA